MKHINISPKLVTTQTGLQKIAEALLAQPVVAVDTESNSLFAYRERVCLIQFSIPGADFLVDPLEIDDISVLGEVFAAPNIEKIFHAAEYDLLTLKRDFGFSFISLFDTMVAARILGKARVGLGSLLEDEFEIKLEKKFQRADWGKRPLSSGMLNYAALDTHFLIRLRANLAGELKKTNRWQIAEEDFTRLCQVNGSPPQPKGVDVWRMNGVRDLSPQQVAILRHLAEYREARAERIDRPLFKVIGDRTLAAIAERAPKSYGELSEIQGMSPGQMRRHGKALLKAVRAGEKDKPMKRPRYPHLDESTSLLLENLREWRKLTARKMGVESDVVMPRNIMECIAHKQPASWEELSELLAEVPWRREQYGKQILSIVRGEKG